MACLAATATLSGFVYVCSAGASGPSVTPIALQNVKLVDYFPAGASWTNMWTDFQPARVQADLATIKGLGANAVRLTIDPYTFGWPTVSPNMASEFQQVVQFAENDGLYVQLTLFDWFANYGDVTDSTTWLESFLAPYANDPEVAFIDLQNEIDTSNSQAMTWARAIMTATKQIAGTIPLTFSISSPEDAAGVQALKAALGSETPTFYDFHYYGLPGGAASVLAAVKSAVAPAPLFVGEAGMSTYSADGPAQEAVLASEEANYYAAVENATASLGLPPAAPWMLSDLVSTGVPYPQDQYPAQWYYGLYTTNGTPKPAASVVQNFFSTGTEPLLLNPGFEQGAGGVPTGWAPTGPSTGTLNWASGTDHAGSYSVEITGSGTQAAWTQVINTGALSTGEQLQATAWAEGTVATGTNYLSVAWFGASGNYLSSNVSSPLPDGTSNWTELGVNATAPAGAAYGVLYLASAKDTGSVYFDDAAVSVVTGAFPALPAVPVTSGVGPTLANPGFEQGAGGVPAGWAPTGPSTGTLNWASGTDHAGSYSVEITGSGTQAAWTQVINTGALSTGEQLQATVWAKGTAATGTNDLEVAWFGASGNWLTSNVSATLPNGTSNWTELGVNATAPAGAAYAVLYLASAKDSGSVYFDDASVSVVTGAFPALPAVPVTSGVGPTLVNPGFEQGANGSPTGWGTTGSGTLNWASGTDHAGSYSVEITGSGTQAAWTQVINTGALSTSEQLQATVWAKGTAATGTNDLEVAWFGASGNWLTSNVSATLPDGTSNWTELGVNATVPAGAAYGVLYLVSSKDSGSVYFDDAAVSVVTGSVAALPAVPATSGVGPTLANPGFEQGAGGVPTGWAPTGPSTGTLNWASGTDHAGSYSVEITGSGTQAAWTQVINTGALSTGEQLQATAWAEGTVATGTNYLSVAWFGASGNYLSSNVSSPLPDGTSNWTELGVNATAPAGAAYGVLYLASAKDTGSVYFDDAAVSVVTGAFPALPAVPVTSGVGPTLANPGFEQGAGGVPTGWAPTGPSTGTLNWASGTDHAGSYSVEITGSGTQAAWTQVINTGALSTGEQLQATVWATGTAATGTNDLEVAWFGASGNWLTSNVSATLPNGTSNWTELGVNATAPAGAAYAVLYLASAKDSGSVYFDDASVSVVTGAFPALPAVPVTSGVGPTLVNPGFEQGANGSPTGWGTTGSGTLNWASGTDHAGSYSVEITGSGTQAAWTQVINTGALSTSEQLQATVWAKGTAATGTNDLEVAWFGASGNWLTSNVSATLPNGTSNWTELGVNATVPAGAAYGVLYLVSSKDSGSVYFDDAAVVL